MRAGLAVMAVLSAAALATGCQGGPAAKAGQPAVTLRFATEDPSINNNGQIQALQDFVDEVSTLSAGRLRIKVDTDVGSGATGSRSAVLDAIQRGTYDGGWNATRAFAPSGFRAFKAVEAPFVIQSYFVEQQFVTSPLAEQMLRRLEGSGLVGLGLVAGPLRRPFAVAHPLVEPSDWRGISFRVFNSPMQTATLAALGARPVFAGAAGIGALLNSGSLGGQEFDLFQYDIDGFANAEPYVTANVALWPKTYALVMNAKRFASLTGQQQQWLRDAAQQAVHESATASFDEDPAAQRMCKTGVRFADATAAQLAALRAQVGPVYDLLRRDPTAAADLAALQAMDAAHPAASTPTVPAGCQGTAPASQVVDTSIKTLPAIPDGIYRVQVSASDLEGYGAEPAHAADNAGTSTMTIRHGTYALRIIFAADPNARSEPAEAGLLRGTANTLVFFPRCPAGTSCGPIPPPYSFGYTYSGGQLKMTVGAGMADPISLGTFASHPWRRIG
jgi:TRAP-type C4-dicarboxylate transport system substrate-binding protein